MFFDEEQVYITGGGCHNGFADYWERDILIGPGSLVSKMRIPEGACYAAFNYSKAPGKVYTASFTIPKRLLGFESIYYESTGEFRELIRHSVKSPIEGKKIAVLGDSLSASSYESPTWWEIVASDTGCEFLEYTYPGTTMASMEPSRGFVERYPAMDETADGVIVLGGTNDVGRLIPIGNWGDTEATTFYGALNVLISGLLTKYKGKPILFFTPVQKKEGAKEDMPVGIEELRAIPADSPMTMPQMRTALLAKCAQYGIPVADLYTRSGINGIDEAGIYYRKAGDSIHPSKKGLVRMANIAASELEELFRYEI